VALKVKAGNIVYILAVPTLIAGEIGTGNLLGVSLAID